MVFYCKDLNKYFRPNALTTTTEPVTYRTKLVNTITVYTTEFACNTNTRFTTSTLALSTTTNWTTTTTTETSTTLAPSATCCPGISDPDGLYGCNCKIYCDTFVKPRHDDVIDNVQAASMADCISHCADIVCWIAWFDRSTFMCTMFASKSIDRKKFTYTESPYIDSVVWVSCDD